MLVVLGIFTYNSPWNHFNINSSYVIISILQINSQKLNFFVISL